jgi:hypothetical protein
MELPRALIESTGERFYSESKITPNGQKLVGEVVTLTNGPDPYINTPLVGK